MASIPLPTVCINLLPGGACCLRETPCPHSNRLSDCAEARLGLRVQLPPDDFLILTLPDGTPSAGAFPLRRCRATTLEHAAGVHTSSLLSSKGDAPLIDACPLPNGSVLLTTRDGQNTLLWREGKFIPA